MFVKDITQMMTYVMNGRMKDKGDLEQPGLTVSVNANDLLYECMFVSITYMCVIVTPRNIETLKN